MACSVSLKCVSAVYPGFSKRIGEIHNITVQYRAIIYNYIRAMWASCLVFLSFIKSIFLVLFFFSGLLLTHFVQKIVIMCEYKVIIPEWLFYHTEHLMRWGFIPTIFLYLFILKKKTFIGYNHSKFSHHKIEKEMILNWTKTVQLQFHYGPV